MEGYISDEDISAALMGHHQPQDPSSSFIGAGDDDDRDYSSPTNNGSSPASNKACWLSKIQEHLLAHGGEKMGREDAEAVLSLPDNVVAVLYRLIKQSHVYQEENTGMSLQMKSIRSEMDRLLQERRGWDERLKIAEEDRMAADNRVSCIQGEHREEKKRWAEERDQLLKQILSLRQKDSQYHAKLRKQEDEYKKLQSRLKENKAGLRSLDITPKPLLQDAGLSGSSSIRQQQQPQQTPRGAKATTTTPSTSTMSLIDEPADEVTKVVLPGLERRVAVLLQENADLKGMLRDMVETVGPLSQQIDALEEERALQRRKKQQQEEEEEEGQDGSGQQQQQSRVPPLEAGAFGMPEEWLAAKVAEPLRHELLELQRRMARLLQGGRGESPSSQGEEGEEEDKDGTMTMLRQRLEETEDLVLQQDRVIRAALFDGCAVEDGDGAPLTSDSWLEEERESLDEERERLRKQKARMEREQSVLDGIAEKLGVDFRKEQQMFGWETTTPPPKMQQRRRSSGAGGGLSGRLSGLLLSPLLQPAAILATTTTTTTTKTTMASFTGGADEEGSPLPFSPMQSLSPIYLTSSAVKPAASSE